MMSMQQVEHGDTPPPSQERSFLELLTEGPGRLIIALVVPVIGFFVLYQSFIFMRDSEASKFAIGVVALVVGVFGVWFLYIATNFLVEQFPINIRETLQPFVFVGPAMIVLTVYLLYPTIDTIRRSFMNRDSSEFVGFQWYEQIFTQSALQSLLINNLLWIIFVTGGTVSVGLLIAVLVDRIGRWEPIAKSLIFLPMAISAVGSSVIWKFMYENKTPPDPEIGFLNAIGENWFGMQGVDIIRESPINNFAFMFIMFWMLTGFCMVILSSAVKGVPSEVLEAGRIDGAGEVRLFFNITVPIIAPTILTVTTTVLIMVLKVFDIVYVFGGQLYDADVIANRMFRELFTYANYGLASALAIVLLIAVIPMIIWNIRELRKG
jgi:alpha-glucoside transport system permease protein